MKSRTVIGTSSLVSLMVVLLILTQMGVAPMVEAGAVSDSYGRPSQFSADAAAPAPTSTATAYPITFTGACSDAIARSIADAVSNAAGDPDADTDTAGAAVRSRLQPVGWVRRRRLPGHPGQPH